MDQEWRVVENGQPRSDALEVARGAIDGIVACRVADIADIACVYTCGADANVELTTRWAKQVVEDMRPLLAVLLDCSADGSAADLHTHCLARSRSLRPSRLPYETLTATRTKR